MQKLSSSQIEHIISFLNSGHSARQIAATVHVSHTSINNIRKEHCPDLQKSIGGRPWHLSAADIHYAKQRIQMGKLDNAVEASRTLSNITNRRIRPQTVRRGLKEAGLRAVVKKKKPALKNSHIHDRLQFARDHLE
jgi:transposase